MLSLLSIFQSIHNPCWCHQMKTFSASLTLCAGNSLVTGEFPSQRPVTRSFDVFCDLYLNKQLSKHSWGWWSDYEVSLMPRTDPAMHYPTNWINTHVAMVALINYMVSQNTYQPSCYMVVIRHVNKLRISMTKLPLLLLFFKWKIQK